MTMAVLNSIIFFICIAAVLHDTIPQVSAVGFLNSTCSTTDPCKIIDSKCVGGTCECNTGYIADKSKTKCLKAAVSYYDSCEEDIQCFLFFGSGSVCENKKCVCESDYHHLHGLCHKTRVINENCNNDDECYEGSEYQASSCKKGVCHCNDGFYKRGLTACRRQIKNIDNECILDSDCDFENGTCVLHKCVLGESLSSNATGIEIDSYILKKDNGIKIGGRCQSDADCQSIEHSTCDVDGTCICERAHFPSSDLTGCVSEIGEQCDQEKVKYQVKDAVCRENMWTCPIDKVATKDNRQCIELTEHISESCKYKEQCQLFGPLSECSNGKCWCNDKSHHINKQRFCWFNKKIGTNCSFDEECFSRGSNLEMQCKNQICVCPDDWHVSDNQLYCLPDKPELKSYCEINEDCRISNAECQENKCYCKENYFEQIGQCVQGLDVKCEKNEDCEVSNAVCHDKGECICRPGYSLVEGQCVKELGKVCEENSECKIENSSCEDKKCTCNENYFELDGICAVGLNADCKKNDDCKLLNNTICHEKDQKCRCDEGFAATPDAHECLPISQHHQECKYDGQCYGALPFTFCNITEGTSRCECIEAYYYREDKCQQKKWLHEECTLPDECFTAYSQCNDGHCMCLPGYKAGEEECNSSKIVVPFFYLVVMMILGLKNLF